MERKAKLVVCAVAFENVEQARRRYYKEFQEDAPSTPTVHRWVERFLSTSDINKRKAGSGRTISASGDDNKTAVELAVAQNPKISIHQMSRDLDV